MPREKKIICRKGDHLTSQSGTIQQMKADEKAKYLGVNFKRAGVDRVDSNGKLKRLMEKITRAPLKPQQRVHLLTTFIQPQMYHELSFAKLFKADLVALDRLTRYFVRMWLRLPQDTHNSIFLASVKDGGLGIKSLATTIPRLRLNRRRSSENPEPIADIQTKKQGRLLAHLSGGKR